YIGDAQGGLVRTEADLASSVPRVWPVVGDALRVVRVAGRCTASLRIGEAAGERRVPWLTDVDHVEAAAARLPAGARADCVGKAGFLVDHDVVCAVDPAVRRVGLELQGRTVECAQLRQVEHLHAMSAGAV